MISFSILNKCCSAPWKKESKIDHSVLKKMSHFSPKALLSGSPAQVWAGSSHSQCFLRPLPVVLLQDLCVLAAILPHTTSQGMGSCAGTSFPLCHCGKKEHPPLLSLSPDNSSFPFPDCTLLLSHDSSSSCILCSAVPSEQSSNLSKVTLLITDRTGIKIKTIWIQSPWTLCNPLVQMRLV